MRGKKYTIKVVFDTNIIHAESFYYLLRKEMSDLITKNSSLMDIKVVWYIPEIVLKERLYQMTKEGKKVLPHIEKLEKLVGHDLGIKQDIIEQKVNEAVGKQIEKYPLEVIKMDLSRINWESIIHNSINRLPPFEDNKSEKGFRDALILECLKQVIDNSPTTKSICRIVFITNDNLLKQAARKLPLPQGNLEVFDTIAELESLINILNSETTEEVIKSIESHASDIFLVIDDKSTLFYTSDIMKKIEEKYMTELNVMKEDVDNRENGTWVINKPGFTNKIKQRVYWKTVIEVGFTEYKYATEIVNVSTNSPTSITFPLTNMQNYLSAPVPEYAQLPVYGLGSSLNNAHLTPNYGLWTLPPTPKNKIREGKTRFEILWSVTLATNKKLKNAKLEEIKYLETIYN